MVFGEANRRWVFPLLESRREKIIGFSAWEHFFPSRVKDGKIGVIFCELLKVKYVSQILWPNTW